MTKEQYKQLLKSIDWKLFRLKILHRDGFKCQNCLNESLIVEKKLKFYQLSLFYEPFHVNPNLTKLSEVEYTIWKSPDVVSSSIKNNLSVGDYLKLTSLQNRKVLVARYCDLNNNEVDFGIVSISNNYNIDLNNPISLTSNANLLEWHFILGLNIHHKYYQDELMPWEYPHDSVQTLCNSCHESLHKSYKVPYKDKLGVVKEELTPCKRCTGCGIFPEYYYINDGICFRCSGAKYEQFITWSFDDDANHLLVKVNRTFRIENVKVKAYQGEKVKFTVLTDQGETIYFWNTNMDRVVEEGQFRGSFRVIDGTQITNEGYLITKTV